MVVADIKYQKKTLGLWLARSATASSAGLDGRTGSRTLAVGLAATETGTADKSKGGGRNKRPVRRRRSAKEEKGSERES